MSKTTQSPARVSRIVATCAVTLACALFASPALADPGDEPWASSSGETGTGLGVVAPQSGRFWAEGAFHTQDGVTAVSPLIGAGFFVTPDVELEFMVPIAFATFDASDDSGFRIGQPYFGANYVYADGPLRFKIGGGIAWMPADLESGEAAGALAYAALMRGWWNFWLWSAEVLSLVAPFRIEYDLGDTVVFGADASFAILIPTFDGGDTEVALQMAPGFGFRLSEEWLLGLRLAAVFVPTAGGDNEQLSFEPYVRGAFGSGFFMARMTLNLDGPGETFDDNGIWGLHAGGGVAW